MEFEIMKHDHRKHISVLLTLMTVAGMALGGCGKQQAPAQISDISEPISAESSIRTAEPELSPKAEESDNAQSEAAGQEENGLQPGDRYQGSIMLEGMEETVLLEHIRNESIGIEMDYDYERFERQSDSERERFVSVYEDPENPLIYLEVTFRPEDADTVADSISEILSQDYEIIREPLELEHAGTCICIDASDAKGHQGTPDLLRAVYLIPAEDGCRVADVHYTWESADGFGKRFRCMIDTLDVIDRQAE